MFRICTFVLHLLSIICIVNAKAIFHLHIQKSGGTMMCELAAENKHRLDNSGWNNCTFAWGDPRGMPFYHKLPRDIDVVTDIGHFSNDDLGYSCMKQEELASGKDFLSIGSFLLHPLCKNSFRYVFVMRNPMSRLSSHVMMHGCASAPHMLSFDVNASPSLQGVGEKTNEFLFQSLWFSNIYIRSLLGPEAYLLPHSQITRQHLEKAKNVLNSLDYAAILEDEQDMTQLVEAELHWASNRYTTYEELNSQEERLNSPANGNRSRSMDELNGIAHKRLASCGITGEQIDEVFRRQTLDMELYKWLHERNQRRLGTFIDTPSYDVNSPQQQAPIVDGFNTIFEQPQVTPQPTNGPKEEDPTHLMKTDECLRMQNEWCEQTRSILYTGRSESSLAQVFARALSPPNGSPPVIVPSPILGLEFTMITEALGAASYARVILQEFQNDTYDLMKDRTKMLVNDGRCVVLDIGANIGTFSVVFGRLYPQCVVNAVEPSHINYAHLMANLCINNITNVCAHRLSISSAENGAMLSFEYDQDNPGGSHLSNIGSDKVVNVQPATFLSQMDADKFAFVKIDCEGCEYDLIANTSSEWLQQMKFIAGEFHYGMPPSVLQKKDEVVHLRTLQRLHDLIGEDRYDFTTEFQQQAGLDVPDKWSEQTEAKLLELESELQQAAQTD